jgi:hypothetical protein
MLEAIHAGDQPQRIRDPAVHVLERDQLSASVRQATDLDGPRRLSGEEPIEDGRRIGLYVAGPPREKRPRSRRAFGRWRMRKTTSRSSPTYAQNDPSSM